MELRSTLLVVGGSVCSFKLLNTIVRFLPKPELERKKAWRWRNLNTSLVHSSLTGSLAFLCLQRHPHLVKDLISSYSLTYHSLVAVSTGYFIYDSLDNALNQSFKKSWELLIHHSVVVSCFSLALTSHLYLGLAVVSLLLEINSVFLHIRQLLLLSGRRNRPGAETTAPRPSVTYRLASWLNLGTLLVFRVCTMGWITCWLAAHSDRMPRYALMMGITGTSLISTMNIGLFYRLLKADVLTNAHSTSKSH